MSRDVYSVITAPLITEKATLVNETGNQVHTVQYLGKERRVGKSRGRRPAWKKAYVTLAAGSRIDFFEGV